MTKPVSNWDNERLRGLPLVCDTTHADTMKEVDKLRRQQADYLASLPVEPKAVIAAALRLMRPGGETYPDGFEDALHLSKALRPMVTHLDTNEPGPDRDALLYIADRVMFGLEEASRHLDRIGDILGNPGRLEREAAVSRFRSAAE